MIRRITLVTILLFAVVGFATAAVAGQTATETEPVNGTVTADAAGPDENASDSAVGPGERLSGVIGVQGAEIEGEVANRTYGIQVAQAATSNARATVVGEQLADIESRIESLEAERDRLEQARENGSIDTGTYHARVATLAAKQRTAERLTNTTNATAGTLPRGVLEKNNVSATAIRSLRHRANELTGPDVAKIARSIAGPPEGIPGHGRPDHVGGPPHENESDDGHGRDGHEQGNETDGHGPSDERNGDTHDEENDGHEGGREQSTDSHGRGTDHQDHHHENDTEPDKSNHDDHSTTKPGDGHHGDGH